MVSFQDLYSCSSWWPNSISLNQEYGNEAPNSASKSLLNDFASVDREGEMQASSSGLTAKAKTTGRKSPASSNRVSLLLKYNMFLFGTGPSVDIQ